MREWRKTIASKADVWTVRGGEEEEEKVERKIYEKNQHRKGQLKREKTNG